MTYDLLNFARCVWVQRSDSISFDARVVKKIADRWTDLKISTDRQALVQYWVRKSESCRLKTGIDASHPCFCFVIIV